MKPGNTLTLLTALAVGLVSYASNEARAQTWDVLNETYGSGAGELSFNASYNYLWGSVAPAETLSAGKATLTIPQGSVGVVYPYKPASLPAWDADTEVTIEWKMAFRQGGSALIYLSQTESTGSSTWGGIEMFDLVYNSAGSVYTLNAIADYGRYTAGQNLAPAGFDSSVPHVYRFVRQGGVNSLYLDNSPVPLISPLANMPGAAAADGYRWGWGFYKNAASDSEVDIYYLKAAHGAFLPPDTIAPTLVSATRGAADPTLVTVQFSEPVRASTATNLGNYSVSAGGPILAATRGSSSSVVLTITSGLISPATLTVSGVQDLASNTIAPSSQITITVPASVWDVMNENYGNGPGEVSFNASYSYYWGSTAPDESLSAGMATLDLHQGSGVKYPVKPPSQPAWAGSGADVTLEWKFAFHGGASALIFLAESQSGGSSWGHILSFDWDYNSTPNFMANTIEDYYVRYSATNMAPSGFDSSLPHVYRLVRQSGINKWYLDGQLLPPPTIGPGSQPDGLRLNWGFYENGSSPSSVDMYYLRAANAALIPGPTDTTPPTAVSAARGNINYAKVTVVYSEPVQAGTAMTPSHYAINHGGPVLSAYEVNSTTYVLTLTSGLSDSVVNTLTINGVKDLAGNTIAVNAQVTVTNTPLWDVINENYGNGASEVSFNASYSYGFGSTAPPETLSPGKATLSLDPAPVGTSIRYPYKSPNVPAWDGGGADVTVEWKFAFHNGAGGHVYLAENQTGSLSAWGHILSFNNSYPAGGTYQADYIEDYYMRNSAVNLAPAGFDSSLAHVYRIVRKAGTNTWYLDGKPLTQPVVAGGAAGDGLRFNWGFNPNPDTPSSVDVCYFRAANGAILPEAILTATKNGNQLTLTWDAQGFIVQENSILTDAGGWTNTPNGNVSPVNVPIGVGPKYFRLQAQ
jgi:hypothetical protein